MRIAHLALIALLLSSSLVWGQTAPSAPAAKPPAPRPPAPERRVALVIGNADYEVAPLRNPTNDAQDMAKALKALGFTVKLLENAAQKPMIEAIYQFGEDLKKGGVGLFYFAGHGVQSKGRNFLIPVNAKLGRESELEFDTVDVGRVLGVMDEAGNRVNMIILDACRDNPFGRNFRVPAKGLAQIEAAQGSYIAFATGPGQTAQDGPARNGVYTGALLENLRKGDSDIDKVFRRVTGDVSRSTDGKQVPWVSSSLTSDFQFRVPKPVAADLAEHDRTFWESVKDTKNPEELNAYLEQYPNGLYARLAKVRLKALTEARPAAPPQTAAATPPATTGLAPPAAVMTAPPATFNVAALPFLSDGARKRVEKEVFTDGKPQRVLAITEAGGWGAAHNRPTVDEARAAALDNCQTRNQRHPCFIVAVNDGSLLPAAYSEKGVREAAIEMIKRAKLTTDFYAGEEKDAGVAVTRERKRGSMHGATPRAHPTATTITTRELVELYKTSKPVLVNVLDWTEGAFALPGTAWIRGMGKPNLSVPQTTDLRLVLSQAVADVNSPVVVYCLSWECWMSYNAALTASELGYRKVYWYRGGQNAWSEAKLPVVRTKLLKDL